MKGRKKIFSLICILMVLGLFTACGGNIQTSSNESGTREETYKIHFIDDSNNEIKMKEPARKIISLYSAHTENLFSLGLEKEIIGVGTSDIYPVQALQKEVYSYKGDPEAIIAAEPDLVLIRPFIERSKPEFVNTMKKAGVNVVSLYPERLEEFDEYIEKLGMLTGKSEIAAEKLDDFHSQIEEIQNRTKNIESKVKVYFESSEADYKTVTADSMPGKAMEMAGGMNIARDVKPIKEGSSIAPYGIEKILERADEIDVFVSQVGVMNAGGNEHSIKIRPGFDTIKAVKNNRICVINQKIISSPTFRYVKGVKELARMFYPQVFDDISKFDQEEMITREQMAELVIRFKNKSIFVPTSKYYNKKQKGHTYGFFEDVKIDDRNFDFIETAVVSGYMEGKKEDNIEKFYPQNQVTREELAQILYLVSELENKNTHREIGDLTLVSNAKIVQMVVDYGLMDLEEGNFNPNEPVAGKEAVKALRQLKNE